MIVFNVVMALAQLAEEPTARNSNLLPVKAKGEVRLRSLFEHDQDDGVVRDFVPALYIF